MIENTIQLPDGRVLGYAEYGCPDGTPVILMGGTPGVRFGPLIFRLDRMVKEGTAPNIRLLVLERPGYGLSEPHPGRKIDHVVEDTAFFADAKELEQFTLFAGSGGAPFALACSLRLPHRVTKTAISAGIGPVYLPELRIGVGKEELEFLQSAADAPQIIISYAEKAYGDPFSFIEQIFAHMPEEKRKQIPAAAKEALVPMIKEGTKSPHGMLDDYRCFGQPWNVKFEDIRVPIRFWHSEADQSVPISHAEYLTNIIPNASLRRFQDLDHVTTSQAALPEVLAFLAK